MEQGKRSGAVIGGWVCFGLGVALMFATLWSFILYGPLFLVAFILAIVAMAQRRVGQGVVLLLASLVVPFILFFGLAATRTASAIAEVKNAPNEKAAVAREAKAEGVYKTTSAELFKAYEANEVATDAAINGRVVEITGRVTSIDKDAFSHIVVHLGTPNQFESSMLTMGDTEASAASALQKGQEVTVRCADMKRMIGSPYGSGCVFVGT